jgi:uncharacterized protein YbjT (DUF2867 family)
MAEPLTLVVGASGLLGTAICRRLLAQSRRVRAMVRRPEKEAPLAALGCATMGADLRTAESLASACEGVATVIVTATALGSDFSRHSLERVDRQGVLALVEAARAKGVRQFIYTSVSPLLPPSCAFIRYKREVEQAVRASGMAYTILQPTAFMEIHAGAMGGWDYERGRARIVGSGRAPVSYISVADVAAFAAASIANPLATNRDLHLGGPEPISALDAVAIAERVRGRPFRVQRTPIPALKALSTLVRPFNPPLSSLLGLVATMDTGIVADMRSLGRDFAIAQTTFESYVRQRISRGPGIEGAGRNATEITAPSAARK